MMVQLRLTQQDVDAINLLAALRPGDPVMISLNADLMSMYEGYMNSGQEIQKDDHP